MLNNNCYYIIITVRNKIKLHSEGEKEMKKFVCTVCGYVYEGDAAPEFCPMCKAPGDKFVEKIEGAIPGLFYNTGDSVPEWINKLIN